MGRMASASGFVLPTVGVANLATPTMALQNHWIVPYDGVHSLSFAALSSSLREGAEAAAPQREAMSLPYGVRGKPQATATNGVHSLREGAKAAAPQAGGCEPPLRVR